MAEYFEIFCGLAVVVVLLYYYFTSTYDFWKVRGVVGPEPIPLFGNIKDVMLLRTTMGTYLQDLYETYKDEPLIGIFSRKTPILIVKDPDLIKDIIIKDFSKFADRGITMTEKIEPLNQHLFSLEPARWRPLRMKLSPTFTSGKLKEMFVLITECANHLEQYIEQLVEKGEPIECRELTAKFTTDVIASCAFGIETNALSNEESEFRRVGRSIFRTDYKQKLKFTFRQSFPQLYNLLGYIISPAEVHTFFEKVIVDTIAYRQKHNIVRHDFVNILLDLRNNPEKVKDIELTDTLLAAQAFVFFAAGFETSSTTISNALYELALNQEIQEKLRKEIREEFKKNGGDLKYDDIKELPYLEKVFRETLRKYPPVMFLMRQSVEDYTFEGTKISIPKKLRVWIPVFAIHRDPNIYPNPDVFDPERFSEEASAARHPMHYLPFGDGPRNCIGARFAVYQTKVGLMKIINKFKVDVCEKTQIPYVIDSTGFLLCPEGGIHLKITKTD